jgi:hypothetical protein
MEKLAPFAGRRSPSNYKKFWDLNIVYFPLQHSDICFICDNDMKIVIMVMELVLVRGVRRQFCVPGKFWSPPPSACRAKKQNCDSKTARMLRHLYFPAMQQANAHASSPIYGLGVGHTTDEGGYSTVPTVRPSVIRHSHTACYLQFWAPRAFTS